MIFHMLNKCVFRTLWNMDEATLHENSLRLKTVFAKISIVDVWQGLTCLTCRAN